MRKVIGVLFLILVLFACKDEVSIDTTEEYSHTELGITTNDLTVQDDNDSGISGLSELSPYSDLLDTKGWVLNSMPTGTDWSFTDRNGENIVIYYKGTPYVGGQTTFKFNNLEIIDLSKCIRFEEEADNDSLLSKCVEFHNGFSFNGTRIDHDFKNSMSNILISKTDDKIALYEGQLVIDFSDNSYTILDENIEYSEGKYKGYILLARAY